MAGKRGMRRTRWRDQDVVVLRRMYPDRYAHEIARRLGCSVARIYAKANKLGLSKSQKFLQMELAKQGQRLRTAGAAHRFHKGQVPANKGLRRPGWYAGRMRETQFKKGQFPVNKDPEFYVLGALRVNADGYIDMRISFRPGALGWRALHLILWEDAHGPIPRGHCLRFKDGDKLNVCLDNLKLLTRAENCRLNSIHRLPPDLKAVIHLNGQLKRKIRERSEQSTGKPGRGRRTEKHHRGAARCAVQDHAGSARR